MVKTTTLVYMVRKLWYLWLENFGIYGILHLPCKICIYLVFMLSFIIIQKSAYDHKIFWDRIHEHLYALYTHNDFFLLSFHRFSDFIKNCLIRIKSIKTTSYVFQTYILTLQKALTKFLCVYSFRSWKNIFDRHTNRWPIKKRLYELVVCKGFWPVLACRRGGGELTLDTI